MAAVERGGATYTPDDLLRFVLSAAKPAVHSNDETTLQIMLFLQKETHSLVISFYTSDLSINSISEKSIKSSKILIRRTSALQ